MSADVHGAVKRTGFLVRSFTELKDAGAGDGTDFAFVSNHDMLSNEIASLFALTLKTYNYLGQYAGYSACSIEINENHII